MKSDVDGCGKSKEMLRLLRNVTMDKRQRTFKPDVSDLFQEGTFFLSHQDSVSNIEKPLTTSVK